MRRRDGYTAAYDPIHVLACPLNVREVAASEAAKARSKVLLGDARAFQADGRAINEKVRLNACDAAGTDRASVPAYGRHGRGAVQGLFEGRCAPQRWQPLPAAAMILYLCTNKMALHRRWHLLSLCPRQPNHPRPMLSHRRAA